MPKLKCIQIGMGWPSEQPGGLNRYFTDLLQHFADHVSAQDLQITGLVMGSQNHHCGHYPIMSVASQSESLLKRWLKLYRTLDRLIIKDRPDLIASHFSPYGVIASALSRKYQIPLVTQFHGPWALEGGTENQSPFKMFFKKRIEAIAYTPSKHFIVLSEAFKSVLIEHYRIDSQKISVIPPGVDLKKFRVKENTTQARTALHWPQDQIILLCVRRLMRRMGIDLLISALKKLGTTDRPVSLYIGGVGPEESALKAQVQALGLDHQVKFLGKIQDSELTLAYQAADLSIVPTREWEGFGLVVAESLACGTPCLVSSNGGLPEVVKGLDPDLVIKELTPQGIASSIQTHLMKPKISPIMDPHLLRQHVLSHFSWDVNSAKILKVYQESALQRTL